jgi:hypothetical protein
MVDISVEKIDKLLTIDEYKKSLLNFFQELLKFAKINSTEEERNNILGYINIKVDEFKNTDQAKQNEIKNAERKAKKAAKKIEIKRQDNFEAKYLKYKTKYINYKN